MAEKKHGAGTAVQHQQPTIDIAEKQATFNAFISFWVYLFGSALIILIFLALVNS